MVERLFVVVLAICFCGVGLIGYLIYDEVTADSYSIRKDRFNCTMSHVETYMTTQKIGEVAMSIPQSTTVCDQ